MTMMASTPVVADEVVRLMVNGRILETDVPPQVVNGRTLAPVRPVAEALGAKVNWHEDTNTVTVDLPEVDSLKRRVELLEQALAPKSAKDAAQLWFEGVKTRNGALQFAALSPGLRSEKQATYESRHWVTGTSSPWIDTYTINEGKQLSDGRVEFLIKFVWTDSTKAKTEAEQTVIVQQFEQNWFVSDVSGWRM